MARKGIKRGKYLKGVIDEELNLGTLAAATLVGDTWDHSVTERAIVTSIVATWSLDGMVAGQGPIIFGVAHADYTDAEIEAVIENTGAWNSGDRTQQEVARRLVRQIGVFVGKQGTGTNDVQWNDGKPVKTKLNWPLITGQTLRMWAYNISAADLSTAAPIMHANGHANIFLK